MTKTAESDKPYKLQFIDVKPAYFHAKAMFDVFVDLPDEDQQEGMCSKLEMSMYGARDAAQNWERSYDLAFFSAGFDAEQ